MAEGSGAEIGLSTSEQVTRPEVVSQPPRTEKPHKKIPKSLTRAQQEEKYAEELRKSLRREAADQIIQQEADRRMQQRRVVQQQAAQPIVEDEKWLQKLARIIPRIR